MSSSIIEGEKRDLESNVTEFEKQKNATNQRAKELETKNNLLDKQLKIANEKQADVTPFHSQACILLRKINQVQLKLAKELYKIKKIEAILKEIENNSLEFQKILSEVTELV